MMICVSVALLGPVSSLPCWELVWFPYLSWVCFLFLVTFFWSIPMTSLWCHWPPSFFLDFVMVRDWKYWDGALRWLLFKTKLWNGSWAAAFLFPHPRVGSRVLDAAGCCAAWLWACWTLCPNLAFLWKEMASPSPTEVTLTQKYLFFLLQALRFFTAEQVMCNIRVLVTTTGYSFTWWSWMTSLEVRSGTYRIKALPLK